MDLYNLCSIIEKTRMNDADGYRNYKEIADEFIKETKPENNPFIFYNNQSFIMDIQQPIHDILNSISEQKLVQYDLLSTVSSMLGCNRSSEPLKGNPDKSEKDAMWE